MTAKYRHPVGLYLLFAVEMWERFSYYGMRALLVLYLVSPVAAGGLGWHETAASRLYGWYTGLVFLTPLIGGYLADRFLGTHRSMLIGGLIISLGHFSLAFQSMPTFYAGLGLIILGTGLFKPNVSTMVGQLYEQNDPRRDAGFTIFYMGINLGAVLGGLVCGYLAESPNWGWHYGFAAAGVGMVLGLVNYSLLKRRFLGTIGDVPARARASGEGADGAQLTRPERDRILALLVVIFFVIFFWAAYEQAGSSMNLFALRNTERTAFGFEFPASWFQSVGPATILIFAPVFAWLWLRLAARGWEPSTPAKMALGLAFLGLGFAFLVVGARTADTGVRVSPFWLVTAYTFHTFGELCLSPVGLSLVTKLAPLRLASLLMGAWFLSNAVANLIAGYAAGAVPLIVSGEYFRVLGGQADFYLLCALWALGAGALLFALVPWLKRHMHGRG